MQAPALLADDATTRARRQTMVDCQIRTFDVTDRRVLDRFLDVPRELFVPDDRRGLAYSDVGLVIEPPSPADEPRYLLPPMILARLIQGGRVKRADQVLDIACGYGYSTAILAGLAGTVTALEATPDLTHELNARLSSFGLRRIDVRSGELTAGLPADGPFDVIVVNGTADTNLDALFGQLRKGGRLLTIRSGPTAREGRATKAFCFAKRNGEVGSRYLFDASAPALRAFRAAPHFVF